MGSTVGGSAAGRIGRSRLRGGFSSLERSVGGGDRSRGSIRDRCGSGEVCSLVIVRIRGASGVAAAVQLLHRHCATSCEHCFLPLTKRFDRGARLGVDLWVHLPHGGHLLRVHHVLLVPTLACSVEPATHGLAFWS